jgi:hypothetical protein
LAGELSLGNVVSAAAQAGITGTTLAARPMYTGHTRNRQLAGSPSRRTNKTPFFIFNIIDRAALFAIVCFYIICNRFTFGNRHFDEIGSANINNYELTKNSASVWSADKSKTSL